MNQYPPGILRALREGEISAHQKRFYGLATSIQIAKTATEALAAAIRLPSVSGMRSSPSNLLRP
jgi:hypothetical protein